MRRRILLGSTCLMGVVGILLVSATAAPAQVGFPGIDLVALLQNIFAAFPPFLQSIVGPIFSALISFFGGGCVPPFCASP